MPKVLNKYHGHIPPDAVYVGRGSPWGNPYPIIPAHRSREEAIALFEKEVLPKLDLTPLRGKDLVCFCAPKPCHADALLREANK